MDLRTLAHDGTWTDAPLDPSWVIAGTPTARCLDLASGSRGRTWVGLWECTAGRFVFHYEVDETIHVLSGGMQLVDEDGVERVVREGDVVLFHAGTSVHWTVNDHVRKLAVIHDLRSPLRRYAGLLLHRLRR